MSIVRNFPPVKGEYGYYISSKQNRINGESWIIERGKEIYHMTSKNKPHEIRSVSFSTSQKLPSEPFLVYAGVILYLDESYNELKKRIERSKKSKFRSSFSSAKQMDTKFNN